MFAGIIKDRAVDFGKFSPVTDAKSAQICSGRQDFIIYVRSLRAVCKEGVIAVKTVFLDIFYGNTASEIVIKMK